MMALYVDIVFGINSMFGVRAMKNGFDDIIQ